MIDVETRARQIHSARHRAGTADTCGSCRDRAAGIPRPGWRQRLAYPARPLRVATGMAVAIVGVVALAAATRPPALLAAAAAVGLLLTAWPYVLWLLYGPPSWPAPATTHPE